MNLEEAKHLGNRHLMPSEKFSVQVQPALPRVVRVTASEEIAASVAGQQCLWMLTNLLARNFAVVTVLEINVPAAATVPGVCLFGYAPTIREALLKTAQLVAGDGMDVREACRRSPADVETGVGTFMSDAAFTVAVLADGWRIVAGLPAVIPAIVPITRDPFGPYFAACIVAGEIFKHLAGLKPGRGRFIDQLVFSLWDYQCHKSWDAAPAGECPEKILLHPFYLVGAGAVGQAAAATLAAAPNIAGYVTAIDHEQIDKTNRNRYALANITNLGAGKVDVIKGVLDRENFTVVPYSGRWQEYVQGRKRPKQREDVEALERKWKFETVLSCVDKNTARHSIQNVWPRILLGASTFECGIQVQLYNLQGPGECLKCSNPIEERVLTIEDEVERWRNMSPLQRCETARAAGLNIEAIEEYLKDPRCGELGQQEIAKFAAIPRPDWSVGFVSVGAGVLLASKLVQSSIAGLDQTFPPHRGQALRFSFLNPDPIVSHHLANPACDCSEKGKAEYHRLWAS